MAQYRLNIEIDFTGLDPDPETHNRTEIITTEVAAVHSLTTQLIEHGYEIVLASSGSWRTD